MTLEESLERDLVARMLEDAADTGQFVPGAKGWRQQQTQIVEEYLAQPDESGTAPLARIHAARKEAWLDQNRRPPDERALLEHALTAVESRPPSPSDASAAIEPLIWLLQQLADGIKLTQTGALPRSIVRAAVERYPNWWDTPTVGPPYQEAEVYPLGILHDLVDPLSLARRHRGILQLTPKGRQALDDPQTLLTQVADMLGPTCQANWSPNSPATPSTNPPTRSAGHSTASLRHSTARFSTTESRQRQPHRSHPHSRHPPRPRPRPQNHTHLNPHRHAPTGPNKETLQEPAWPQPSDAASPPPSRSRAPTPRHKSLWPPAGRFSGAPLADPGGSRRVKKLLDALPRRSPNMTPRVRAIRWALFRRMQGSVRVRP